MVEIITTIATLAIIILGWSYVKRAMEWTGNRIAETTDVITDVTKSASYQTARGTAISRDSLKDTILESRKKEAKRQEAEAKFLKDLTPEQLKAIKEEDKFLNSLLNR